MKRLILLLTSVSIMGASSFAQTCGKNHPIFKFDNPGTATAVHSLGANPQNPALRNKASVDALVNGMKAKPSRELNNMLKEIGFADGARSVKASNVTATTISAGTTGNMGDGNNNYHYVKMASTFKAWKITSDDGCSVYVLAQCGNTFFPGSGVANAAVAPKCKDITVNVTGEPKEVTVADANRNMVRERTYVYFKKGCSGKVSKPILAGSRDIAEATATTYRVTPNSTQTVRVCGDQPVTVTTDLNVEKVSGFSGFKRSDKKVYKLVSKREYKQYLRSEHSCDASCK